MADEGKLKLYKKIEALQLWRKMLSMLFETGHPWITFKDPQILDHPKIIWALYTALIYAQRSY
jgi:ribonucleoside-diphosphate reductase alpha chain